MRTDGGCSVGRRREIERSGARKCERERERESVPHSEGKGIFVRIPGRGRDTRQERARIDDEFLDSQISILSRPSNPISPLSLPLHCPGPG